MNHHRRVALVLVSFGLGLLQSVTPAAAGPSPSPTVVMDQYSVSEGTFVKVSGTGWSAAGNGLVSVQVCGNGAIDASADCHLAGTVAGGVREGGTFYTGITIHRPPKPCPCVLRAYTSVGPTVVTTPIEIEGMPSAIPGPAQGTTRRVSVSGVTVKRADPWTMWFGGAPGRQVLFTVTNTGDVVLHHPAVTLAWGRGQSPDGFMRAPDLGDLVPGQTVVSRVDMPMGAMSYGTYRVTVRVDPIGGQAASAFAETTTYPWGLMVGALVVAQICLLWLRNKYRSRGAGPASEHGSPTVSDESDADEVHVPTTVTMSLSTPLRNDRWRRAGLLMGAAVLVGVLVGCSSSGDDSAGDDSPEDDASLEMEASDPDCPLTLEQAQGLLPAGAAVAEVPPLGTAVDEPTARCQYESAGWSIQLSVFAGPETFGQLTGLVPEADPAPEVSENAVCGTFQGATTSSASCLFIARGSTYALVLNVPNESLDETLEPRVRELASGLASES